jgi:hypothetical protein
MKTDDQLGAALRRDLHATLVPFDAARADAMIHVAIADGGPSNHRYRTAPIAAAAAIVAVGGGVALLATGSGQHTPTDASSATHLSPATSATPRTTTSSARAVVSQTDTPSSSGTPITFSIRTETAPGARRTFEGKRVPKDAKLAVTAFILQNPHADAGTLRILRGPDLVLHERLANFRDLDFNLADHPVVFTSTGPLRVEVSCANASRTCDPAVLVIGSLVRS